MSRWKPVPAHMKKRRRVFNQQRSNATRRGVPFHLTFEQWWMLWECSGKWSERGRCMGQYCMARKGDCGAYTVDNVSIVTVSHNGSEIKPYVRDEVWRHHQAQRMKGNTFNIGRKVSEQTRERLRRSLKGRVPGFGGKHHSEETKARKRLAWKNQFGEGPAYHG